MNSKTTLLHRTNHNGLFFPGQERSGPTKQPHPWLNLTNWINKKQAGLIVDHKALDVVRKVDLAAPNRPGPTTRHPRKADILRDYGVWHKFCAYPAHQLLPTTGSLYQKIIISTCSHACQTRGRIAITHE